MSQHLPSFTCYLIGGDSLLIECGEILLAKGHHILGVITNEARLSQWALSKSIASIAADANYGEKLKAVPFDYLFSITHLAIIKDDVLALPKKMTVNFHDGPLPAYAGLNAPAWALMHQEERYGISWHQVIPAVDEGALLKQLMFEVSATETSLSINTKCFAAALDSFPELVNELVADSTQLIQQDLSKRSYFAKYQRPEAMGLLNWGKTAEALAAFIRAMNFGEYPNLLSTAKIHLNGRIYAVVDAVAQEQETTAAPGTIVAVEDTAIHVATVDGVLSLTALSDLSGAAMAVPGLALIAGDQFNNLSAEVLHRLTEINQLLCRHDESWAKHLGALDPIEIPYANSESSAGAIQAHYQTLAVAGAADFTGVQSEQPEYTLAAAFALLLSRLGRKTDFDLAFVNAAIQDRADVLPGLISDRAVAGVSIDVAQASNEALAAVSVQLKTVADQGAWVKDIIGRFPRLQQLPELVDGTALPVALSIDCDQPVLGSALTLVVTKNGANLHYDTRRLSVAEVQTLAQQYTTLLHNMAAAPERPCGQIELLSPEQQRRILHDWNATERAYDNTQCLHHLFEQQVQARPNAAAAVFENQTISYDDLNQRANTMARELIGRGVQADELVGVNVERSIDLLVATLGIWKAGAAYVPLDPAFPADRISYMMDDAKMRIVITQTTIQHELPPSQADIICVDSVSTSSEVVSNLNIATDATTLAYVIYTSGSTGKPKGVMVEHRNVVNFFLGMDERIEHDPPGAWLAVTSLSFDISVLELFWTLTRGFKVIVYKEDRGAQQAAADKKLQRRPMGFGLFMWGNDDAPGSAKYKLMMDGAKYFDDNGFDAVWTPERHFSAFGGPYPNPAVTSAALAAITKNVHIRSGSIVSPLHHAIRIAEDWAVVDNLSDGRVGLSFAAGWQPNDFIIRPENHGNNKQVMMEQIDIVRKLWRGEAVAFENPLGHKTDITTLPRPVQKELPVWFTTAGNPESYRQAGKLGANVLTHLLGQSIEELSEKIRIYREARKEAGLNPATGQVTLMLHTFVGESDDDVRELVREPMKDYLRSAMKLVIGYAWSFPAFKRPGGQDSKPEDIDIKDLTEEESDTILNFAFERYFETSGLFGTTDTCGQMIDRCKLADVDEIACLLDFGVDTAKVMAGLPLLKSVKDQANGYGAELDDEGAAMSLPAQLDRHQVTHFQCTPSMARMLCADNEAHASLGKLKHMMVGGEAFPNSVAKELKGILTGRLTNMYGPTETTIWSTTHEVDQPDLIPIGRPIANTDIFILDQHYQPVPPGVPGDLYIGGDGVVRGYLHRPELTAERFIASPFDVDKRIYWTGDLAQYREDGTIDFLGRVDHQVKIRGYRIEMGEIEALLAQHDSVRECVLLLREDIPGDQRLVAYIVPAVMAPDVGDLKNHLRQHLPEYMVPNDVLVLDSMPLTPNGKLDRKQLPSPQGLTQTVTVDYVAPANELQETIVQVWQQTLQMDKVGVNDNFFDLGGHSLLIVRVHQLLKEHVEKTISLTDLYRFPTIRTLTEFLNADDVNASLKQSSNRAARRRERMGLRKRNRH